MSFSPIAHPSRACPTPPFREEGAPNARELPLETWKKKQRRREGRGWESEVRREVRRPLTQAPPPLCPRGPEGESIREQKK
jgi:hypothetical protein